MIRIKGISSKIGTREGDLGGGGMPK